MQLILNQTKTDYIMRLRWLLVPLMLFVTSPLAMSQGDDRVPPPSQSELYLYSGLKEERSIVRCDNNYRVVHIEYKISTTGINLHTFLIKSNLTGAEMAFSTYFDAPDSTVHTVYITDMEMYDGECYFCGYAQYDYVDEDGFPMSNGIVGHFSPQAMQSGSGMFLYSIVDKTKSLFRLAPDCGSAASYALVSAVGVKPDNTACLLELDHTILYGWKATLDYVSNIPKIYFSDILTTFDSIVLLAQMKCANNYLQGHPNYDANHQGFILDKFSLSGCMNDCSTSVMTHYMSHYSIPINEGCYFHPNMAQMALGRVDLRGFAVSYGVHEDNGNWGLRLFPFQNIWHYDSCIYYRTGNSARILDIRNLGLTRVLYLLSVDASHPKGLVSIPSISGTAHTVMTLYNTDHTTNSFAQWRNTTFIDITGHTVGYDFSLLHQEITDTPVASCFTKSQQDYTVFPRRNAAQLVAEWKFEEIEDFEWTEAEIIKNLHYEWDKICSKYYHE